MKEKILNMRLFRWISSWKLYQFFHNHPVFGKLANYEMITYVIAGAMTTLVNYVVYFLVPQNVRDTSAGIIFAQILAWAAAVLFAFVVNKIFVFDSASWSKKTLLKELVPFVLCRIASLGLDTVFVYVTVHVLGWNEPLFKLLSNVFVLVANYIASKYLIFNKNTDTKEDSHA